MTWNRSASFGKAGSAYGVYPEFKLYCWNCRYSQADLGCSRGWVPSSGIPGWKPLQGKCCGACKSSAQCSSKNCFPKASPCTGLSVTGSIMQLSCLNKSLFLWICSHKYMFLLRLHRLLSKCIESQLVSIFMASMCLVNLFYTACYSNILSCMTAFSAAWLAFCPWRPFLTLHFCLLILADQWTSKCWRRWNHNWRLESHCAKSRSEGCIFEGVVFINMSLWAESPFRAGLSTILVFL